MKARKPASTALAPRFTIAGEALRAALIAAATTTDVRHHLRAVRIIVRKQKGTCIGTDVNLLWATRFDATECADLDASIPSYGLRDLRLMRRSFTITVNPLAGTWTLEAAKSNDVRSGALVTSPRGKSEPYPWPLRWPDGKADTQHYIQPALLARLQRCAETLGYRYPAMPIGNGIALLNCRNEAFGAAMPTMVEVQSRHCANTFPDWAKSGATPSNKPAAKPAARSAGRKAA
jgi:hypothetical protein